MENKNQTMAETLNEMHAAIDKCMAALATLIASVKTPSVGNVDTDEVVDKIVERADVICDISDKVAAKIDTDDIVDRVTDSIDTSDIADRVADSVTDDIDKDDIENRVVEKIEDSIDKDDIAEKIAGRLTDKILHALRDEVNS